MDDTRARPETSLPPLRDDGQSPAAMTAEERERWMLHSRLQQFDVAEAKAWRRFAWGVGIYFGLMLLFLLGIWLTGGWFYHPKKPGHERALWFVGATIRGLSGSFLCLLAIPLLLRFVRWVEAMWRRRRFSSGRGAGAGQLR